MWNLCGYMWGGVFEPNQASPGMVQAVYVNICGIYVGLCGRLCVNQNVIPKTTDIAYMWKSMWVYVESMWVYVDLCGSM